MLVKVCQYLPDIGGYLWKYLRSQKGVQWAEQTSWEPVECRPLLPNKRPCPSGNAPVLLAKIFYFWKTPWRILPQCCRQNIPGILWKAKVAPVLPVKYSWKNGYVRQLALVLPADILGKFGLYANTQQRKCWPLSPFCIVLLSPFCIVLLYWQKVNNLMSYCLSILLCWPPAVPTDQTYLQSKEQAALYVLNSLHLLSILSLLVPFWTP